MPTAGTDDPGSAGNTGAGASGALLTDAQIAAIMALVHNTEIDQARLALAKSKDPQVLSFASLMLTEHNQAKQQESTLGMSTAASPTQQMLAARGQETTASLQDKSGKEFDRAYLQAQVDQHQQALDSIDRQLLPAAKNPQLRAHLQQIRPGIEQHLRTAREARQAVED